MLFKIKKAQKNQLKVYNDGIVVFIKRNSQRMFRNKNADENDLASWEMLNQVSIGSIPTCSR
jgi:hypothetical protein